MVKKKTFRKSQKSTPAETPTLTLKEQLAQKRQAAKAKKELTSLLTTCISVGFVVGIILFFAVGVKLAVPGALGIIIISLCYKYPRPALLAFLIYLPFAGTVVYYIGNSPILQLAKDAFYAPAAIAIWQMYKTKKQPFFAPKALVTPIKILWVCCLLTLIFINGGQQFAPKDPGEIPIGLGILGLKVLMGYIPIITCFYYLIRDKKDFLLISRIQIFLIIICCILGILQYILLLTGICKGTVGVTGDALFKASIEARCYFGGSLLYTPEEGVIRLPGTFNAPWQWAWFLIGSTFFAFGTGFSDPSIIWRLASLLSLALVFANAVISGQRIALALVPVCFVILLIFTGQIGNLKRFIPLAGGLAVILFIAMAANPTLVAERLESFTGRWEASPPHEFIVDQFQENWKNVDTPIGSGLGRATNSARTMGKTKLVETYYPKVLYEVGIVGVMAFLYLVTIITINAFKTYKTLKNPIFRTYGASMATFIMFISYNTYYYPLDVDPVAVYYWMAAGIVFKLPLLDQQETNDINSQSLIEEKHHKPKPKKF